MASMAQNCSHHRDSPQHRICTSTYRDPTPRSVDATQQEEASHGCAVALI